MPPPLSSLDHVHIFVEDRVRAEVWMRDIMGLERVPELASWASGGGPLMVPQPTAP